MSVDATGHALQRLLAMVDATDQADSHGRRTAFKPLHDFLMRVARHCMETFLGVPSAHINDYALNRRYEMIGHRLHLLADAGLEKEIETWRTYVSAISNRRNQIEHKDEADPSDVQALRARAEEFAGWILDACKKYHAASPSFAGRARFVSLADDADWRLETLLTRYGEPVPHCVKQSDPIGEATAAWEGLPNLRQNIQNRREAIATGEEPLPSDYELLIEASSIRTHCETASYMAIKGDACPRCGGAIVEKNETYARGDPEDGNGVAVQWIGCEVCAYEVHSDQIEI